ncbi:MAG TPA: DUF4325 domain-containing protein [Candidatus Berkiella sp.]|nr:DUF4325 domain-containing protein [Candidatus Berkiella sp.]
MTQPTEIKAFLIKHIANHPRNIVAFAAGTLNVTRTTIHRHLNALIKQKKIIRSGTTKQAHYYLTSERDRRFTLKIATELTEEDVWMKHLNSEFKDLSVHAQEILHYGFTEIFNNVLDHAFAKNVIVSLDWNDETAHLTVQDDGIGVFERLNLVFHFQDYRESLLHLTKGKLTTDPINHTGEGLFFTSRVFDNFCLIANGLRFFRNNQESDWTVESVSQEKGTKVIMELNTRIARKISDVFNKYTDDFEFNKTDLLVNLSQLAGERLISRSQAKRLFARLEPFTQVTLDFNHVLSVGQGFVDEVFRVYPSKNPQVKINYINANDDVIFMIKRSLPK